LWIYYAVILFYRNEKHNCERNRYKISKKDILEKFLFVFGIAGSRPARDFLLIHVKRKQKRAPRQGETSPTESVRVSKVGS
jgi:hypothetical protein